MRMDGTAGRPKTWSQIPKLAVALVLLVAACGPSSPTGSLPPTSAPASSEPPPPSPSPTPVGELLSWTQVSTPEEFVGVNVTGMAATSSKWFAFGSGHMGFVILSSDDGMAWTRTVVDALGLPVDVAEHDGTYIAVTWAVGSDAINAGAVQRSTDGETWTAVDLGGGGESHAVTGVVATDEGFVAVGWSYVDPYPGLAWLSADGVTWERAILAADGAPQALDRLPDGRLVAGGQDLDGARLWSSVDGSDWTAEDPGTEEAEYVLHLAANEDGVLSYLESCSVEPCYGLLETSANLRSWKAADDSFEQQNLAIVGAGSGWLGREHQPSGDILWSSDNGVSWEAGPEPEFGPNTFFDIGWRDGQAIAAVETNLRPRGIYAASVSP